MMLTAAVLVTVTATATRKSVLAKAPRTNLPVLSGPCADLDLFSDRVDRERTERETTRGSRSYGFL